MNTRTHLTLMALIAAVLLPLAPAVALEQSVPESDTLMRALSDELTRSMDLQMEDLEKPYFIQFNVSDGVYHSISAEYGAVVSSDHQRLRRFRSRVRVGSYDLDNTNFAGQSSYYYRRGSSGGARANLPLDDDYLAIRQAIWEATDRDYKSAVETLTRKRAYMKDKTIEDRADDFTKADPVQHTDPPAVFKLDVPAWEKNLETISAVFSKYPQIQDSGARLIVGAGNEYVVTSGGTRVRTAGHRAMLFVTAEAQADDGMKLADNRSYVADTAAELPAVDAILKDIDEMVSTLTTSMKAEPIEHYSGPVLFDGVAAGQLFRAMLAEGVAAEPDVVGEQRRGPSGAENLEQRLNTRILPRSFKVWDDPTTDTYDGEVLLGAYHYDDEGMPAQKVSIVEAGRLKDMCMSRVPTKKLSGTNGHARESGDGGEQEPAIGCLYVQDEDGIPADELKQELIDAAKDEGLEYGIRVASMKAAGMTSTRADFLAMYRRAQRGGGSPLGDPIVAYKVYVSDGHEEPIRGCEFGQIEVSDLKHILAGGNKPTVYNYVGVGYSGATPPSSIIAPSVLLEEVDLSKIEAEHDRLPILAAPNVRTK